MNWLICLFFSEINNKNLEHTNLYKISIYIFNKNNTTICECVCRTTNNELETMLFQMIFKLCHLNRLKKKIKLLVMQLYEKYFNDQIMWLIKKKYIYNKNSLLKIIFQNLIYSHYYDMFIWVNYRNFIFLLLFWRIINN